MKDCLYILAGFLTLSACGDEPGACTISCGGSGTGQPFFWENIPFKTEKECKAIGQDRGSGCKASYYPPTGNSNDCYQVYP